MHLDDIEEETAPRVEQYLSQIKVLRQIAHKLISFLEQLENFQKKLWLKKKFVVETNYCITLDRVPEKLYPEICANDAQREEWVKLFAIDEIKGDAGGLPGKDSPAYSVPLTADFLKANDKLVLDTAFFSSDFKARLITSIENFDEQCDGLLIHSENFQALNLLQERYRGHLKCIHIDPPYNTDTSGFLYKNSYQHSSWLSLMENRISLSINLLSKNASYLCHIDENEYENLHNLFENSSLLNSGTIIWDKRNPMNGGNGVANQHEYIIVRSNEKRPICLRNKTILSMLSKAASLIKKNGGVTENTRKQFSTWVNSNEELSGGEKAYRYIDEKGRIYQSVSLRAPEPRQDPKFHEPLIHPQTGLPCAMPPNGFSRTPENLKEMMDNGLILFGKDETTQPRQKSFLTVDSKRQMSSLIQDAKKGKFWTDALGLSFPYCHPVSLYEEIVGAVTQDMNSITMDYFAGSGTTGHALLNLNREDQGGRKYVLVEIGLHFDTTLKPRITKVIYSSDWKNGKPASYDTGVSQCFKYIRLESYEDTLNNLEFKKTGIQGALLTVSPSLKEEYMLSYMMDLETEGSASLLNVNRFDDPWNYTMKIATGSAGETRTRPVDLVETFNYLIGLTVIRRDFLKGIEVIEGTNPEGDNVLVIWRNTKETSNEQLDEFFRKQDYNTRDTEFDLIYVNGDNNLENLKKPDETWKVRLIEEDFKRLMFEVEDV
jgi:adenine-specific DNA-methyltransferase